MIMHTTVTSVETLSLRFRAPLHPVASSTAAVLTKRWFSEMSGIKTRLPIYYAAGFLVLLGLLPKFGALAQIILAQFLVERCWSCLVSYLFRDADSCAC